MLFYVVMCVIPKMFVSLQSDLRFDTDAEDGYMWINKETMAIKHVSGEEFKEIKKNYDL